MLIQGVSLITIYLYFCISFYSSNNLWFNAIKLQYYVCFYRRYTHYSSQLTGKLVDYIDELLLLRIMSTIQVIGVIIVSLTLLNHWTFGYFLVAL